MSGLENLNKLEKLNLSCNKITQIIGIKQMAKSLKVLNLSHNRIVSLYALKEFSEISVLEIIDLTDNYIGELSHIKSLQHFRNLREIFF
jgi:Leucine-rich repeat (LRR) protein